MDSGVGESGQLLSSMVYVGREEWEEHIPVKRPCQDEIIVRREFAEPGLEFALVD